MRWWVRQPAIPLGTTSFWHLGRWPLSITRDEACSHMHILGKTGSGKSYLLAGLFLSLYAAGMPVTLIDPHGDLAELILAQLVAQGIFADPHGFEQLVYLDIPAAAASNRFLPFNFLDQPYDDHAMAELVAEAARRAWPELAFGAPTFENILKHSVIALRQNKEPLTRLADLLTDKPYREELLRHVTDPQVVRFFHLRMDQWGRDEAHMKESTLNRADLLTLNPFLRQSLGAPDNTLNFRQVIDTGRSVIINLALPHHDARRLLGCLLTVGMETAALSRAGTPGQRQSHHLILDEFSQFMAQSEQALTRMLSETRKYKLFCMMAHQNWTQASEKLRGALQNCGIEAILKTGRMDAEYSARILGAVDPMTIKHVVQNEDAEERTHPTYLSLNEQWEKQVQALQQLRTGEAIIRLSDDSVHKVKTRTLPAICVSDEQLAGIKTIYLKRYFRSVPPPRSGEPPFPPPGLRIGRRPAGQRMTVYDPTGDVAYHSGLIIATPASVSFRMIAPELRANRTPKHQNP